MALPKFPSLAALEREAKDWVMEMVIRDAGGPENADVRASGRGTADGRTAVAARYHFDSWADLVAEVAVRRGDGVGIIPVAQMRLLRELSTTEHRHGGGTLFDHLAGTRTLLVEWGNDEDLAAAGLFHSIYGTQAYKIQSASLDRRGEVADTIGNRAEEFAYLFCVSDRKGFWTEIDQPAPKLDDLVHATRIEISPETLDCLIEIEVANIIEQVWPAPHFSATDLARLRRMLEVGVGHMSSAAATALGGLVEECAAVTNDR